MKNGLLWYDGSTRPFEEKVREAAERYRDKWDRWPDTCYVHPKALAREAMIAVSKNGDDRVVVRCLRDPTTLPGHLRIGCEEREVA